ncbi:MAG: hypothetical protein WC758_00230 [Candidatus Woesearchaeota archaeon]|jgi:hypothetical protein
MEYTNNRRSYIRKDRRLVDARVSACILEEILMQEQQNELFSLGVVVEDLKLLPEFINSLEKIASDNYSFLKDRTISGIDVATNLVMQGEDVLTLTFKKSYTQINKMLLTAFAVVGLSVGAAIFELPKSNYGSKLNILNSILIDDFSDGKTLHIDKNINDLSCFKEKIEGNTLDFETFKNELHTIGNDITGKSIVKYKEVVGAATIYADQFEGKKLFSGGVFSQEKIICAVPKGSEWAPRINKGKYELMHLKIINLETGNSIVTKAVDIGNFGYSKGGPNKYTFIEGQVRVIDLSKKAALKLGGISARQYSSGKDVYSNFHVKVIPLGYR